MNKKYKKVIIILIILSTLILILLPKPKKQEKHTITYNEMLEKISLVTSVNVCKFDKYDSTCKDSKLIKHISDKSSVDKIKDIINNATLYDGAVAWDISSGTYILQMLNKDNDIIAEIEFIPGLYVNIEHEKFILIEYDFDILKELIEN